MQLQSSGWLSHHGIWAIIRVHIPCSPNINGNCTCLLKIKNKLKIRLFLQIKFGKNSQCFVGVFNQAIIINPLCLLLDMRMIIANSVLCTSLAIYHRTVTKSRGPGDVPRLQWAWAPATMSMSPGYFHRNQRENRTKRTSFLYNSPPLLYVPGNLKF